MPVKDRGKVTGLMLTLANVTERIKTEEKMSIQLAELQRWQEVTFGREGRILELKLEVNKLAKRLGEQPHYKSTN